MFLKDLQDRILKVIEKQNLAVLGTSLNNKPHTTLVAFKTDISKRKAFFATRISSRKSKNIENNPYVSLFIDNRTNSINDFKDALGITLKGIAAITDDEYQDYFLDKHPHLEEFVKSPSTKIFKVTLQSVEVVTQFQKIYELNLDE